MKIQSEKCPKCGAIRTSEDAKYCVCGHKRVDVDMPDFLKDMFNEAFGKEKKK